MSDEDDRKARAILDALTLQNTRGLTLTQLAQIIADEFAALEDSRNDLAEKLDDIADAALDAESGYHAFATALAWRYPDGEPMPAWNQLNEETQRAFRAFAQGAIR